MMRNNFTILALFILAGCNFNQNKALRPNTIYGWQAKLEQNSKKYKLVCQKYEKKINSNGNAETVSVVVDNKYCASLPEKQKIEMEKTIRLLNS